MDTENILNSLKIIDLSSAILNDDLESAKILVEELNQLPSSIYEYGFNFYDFYNCKNETLDYVFNNLTNYPNMEKIIWDYSVGQIIKQYQNTEITDDQVINFINQALNNVKDYYYPALIRLANIIHNYDILIHIKNKILPEEE